MDSTARRFPASVGLALGVVACIRAALDAVFDSVRLQAQRGGALGECTICHLPFGNCILSDLSANCAPGPPFEWPRCEATLCSQ